MQGDAIASKMLINAFARTKFKIIKKNYSKSKKYRIIKKIILNLKHIKLSKTIILNFKKNH